jgi:uncharacterized membrane protein
MRVIAAHIARCMVAGIVAILPIGGLVLTVVWMESAISESYLARQSWYFPGLGLLAAGVLIYLIGLTVSSLIGRWLWNRVDRLLHHVPLLGHVYATLKQIVGYGQGRDALFQQVVLVPRGEDGCHEIGLVTDRRTGEDGRVTLNVFVPLAPTPTLGRLMTIDAERVVPTSMAVSEAIKTLVSVGAGGRIERGE